MKQFKYKTSFASQIRCLINEEKDKFLAEASLKSLKSLIPDEVKEQRDLFCVAFNACNVNLANKNGDLIDTKIAESMYKSFIHKAINIEHERSGGAIGHITSASFSKFDANFASGAGSDILEASEIKEKKEPFNISLSGVLYRLYAEKFIDYIEEGNDPNSSHYLDVSASWELMFDEYVLAVGSKYLEECEIIDDPKKIEQMSKYLLGEGGNGKTPDGKIISRLIVGEVIPIGIGLTQSPAGEVKGVITASKTEESHASEHFVEKCSCGEKIGGCLCSSENKKVVIIEKGCEKCKKTQNSDSQSKPDDVKANTSIKNIDKPMIKNLKDITDENLKEAKAADISKVLDSEIDRISTEWKEKKEKVDSELKASKEIQEKTQKDLTEANEKLAKVQEDLNKLIKAAQDKQAEEVFSARMNYFDSEYELDEKSRNAVANRIKSLDEEAYKKEKEDLEYLLAAKKKGFVPFKKGEKEDSKEDKKEDKKESKASEVKKEEGQAAIDKAIDNGTKVAAAVAVTTAPEVTQADKWAKAFSKENWELDLRFIRK